MGRTGSSSKYRLPPSKTNDGRAEDFLEGRNGDLSNDDHVAGFESADMPPSKQHIPKQEKNRSSSAILTLAPATEKSVDEVRDFENSSNAPNDSSMATSSVHAATQSRLKGKVRSTTPLLDAAKRGSAQKKK